MLTRADLRPYQTFFIAKMRQCFHADPRKRLPGVMLALEPGAGKTAATETALMDALDAGEIEKALIVAPLLVAQTVWPEEPREWEHLLPLLDRIVLLRVEDDDADIEDVGAAAYEGALARFQAEFETEREIALLLDSSKSDARRKAKAANGSAPSARAEVVRQEAVATAKAAKLRTLFEDPRPIHVVNREALPDLWAHFGAGARWPYDVMVIDDVREGRSAKQRTRTKKDDGVKKSAAPLSRFGIMAAARKHMKATIQLTGTPTPNGLKNMWGLIYLIDLGKRLGLYKSPFYKRWFHLDKFHQPDEPKAGAFETIMGRAKDIMFSLDSADLPQLPPYIVDPVRVKLDPAVMQEYRRFKRNMVSEEYDVEAVNAGVMHGKLLQFANGSMYREDGEDVWVHDAKIDALKILVERLNGTPLLVAYTYQFDVERIMKAFPEAVLLRPENAKEFTRRWNNDEITVGIAHRASAGHGLNLQKGTGHMCEYGLTSDAELYLQFLKRLWRPGRRGTVFNHVIIAEGTIDEEVFPDYLDPKIETQRRVMEEVKVSFGGDLAELIS